MEERVFLGRFRAATASGKKTSPHLGGVACVEDELELSDHSYPSLISSLNPLLIQVQKDIIFQMRGLPRPAISEHPRPLRRVPRPGRGGGGRRVSPALQAGRAPGGRAPAAGTCPSEIAHGRAGARRVKQLQAGPARARPVLPLLRWVSGATHTEQRPGVRGCCWPPSPALWHRGKGPLAAEQRAPRRRGAPCFTCTVAAHRGLRFFLFFIPPPLFFYPNRCSRRKLVSKQEDLCFSPGLANVQS